MNTPTQVWALVAGDTVKGLVAEDSVKKLMAQTSVKRLAVKDSGMDFDKAHVHDLGAEDSGKNSDEDSGINMTADSDIDIPKHFLVAFPTGFFIITSDGEIIDLITHPRMLLDDVFQFFPDYEPRFRGEPHLNSLHRFVCEDACFLRNWLFVQDMLFARFWGRFCRTSHACSLDSDAVGALGEIMSFFAFATIPFDTRRLPNNDWIGNYGRLLRLDANTFRLVWEFYQGPLRFELGDALPRDTISNIAERMVANVCLDHESQLASDPERIDATVCFNSDNSVHLREVQRSWMNFRNNVDKRLEQLGPCKGCCGEKEGKMPTILPKEYFPLGEKLGDHIIEPPRIRRYYWKNEPAPRLVNHDWWDTAAHHYNFVADAQERSRPVSREEPEPPRQSTYGIGML